MSSVFPMSSAQVPQFIWESDILGAVPRWLSPPDIIAIENLCKSNLRLPSDYQVAATFFAEGAFNKLYTIAISDCGRNGNLDSYIFRATSPVEPFYKTSSEVAMYSYLREHTSIPIPRIIAHSSTAENEVGCEWILMEKIAGVTLADVWRDIDLETKSKQIRTISDFWRQLQKQRFGAIGNLYLSQDIDELNGAVRVVATDDEKYVLGPVVTPYMFRGGRKLRVPRNLGPYTNDAEYMAALVASQREDMKLLLSADAHSHPDFDEDVAEIAEEVIEALDELQTTSAAVFPSGPRDFSLVHHDLSLTNILVDPATNEITSIVDWECVGTRPHWEGKFPQLLDPVGPESSELEVEPLAPGDTDEVRVEHWENWERRQLRLKFERELGEVRHVDDGKDEIRREFRQQLDWVEISPAKVKNWMKTTPKGRNK